jgi:putative ABC transport system ATP-binding protein
MDTRLISTINLQRHYHRGHQTLKALDGVDLNVQRGELVAVVGSSGSGKSTLLNLIAGLDTPTDGYIEFESIRLDNMSRRELARYRAKSVGIVFQSFNLLPHQTALRNVEMSLYFDGTHRSERRAKAAHVLEKLGLSDRLEHRPVDLSGGEQQRVAIARAIVKKPRLLLADEPTGNLDKDNSRVIAGLLKELNREDLTIVVVTHDADLAGAVAERHLRIEYGRFVDTGDAEEVRQP